MHLEHINHWLIYKHLGAVEKSNVFSWWMYGMFLYIYKIPCDVLVLVFIYFTSTFLYAMSYGVSAQNNNIVILKYLLSML